VISAGKNNAFIDQMCLSVDTTRVNHLTVSITGFRNVDAGVNSVERHFD